MPDADLMSSTSKDFKLGDEALKSCQKTFELEGKNLTMMMEDKSLIFKVNVPLRSKIK